MIPASLRLLLLLSLSLAPAMALAADLNPWSDIAPEVIPPVGERLIEPVYYRTTEVDLTSLKDLLATAPMEFSAAAASPAVLVLPLPDGTNGRFALVESPVMAAELQARYPEIRTYSGHGLDDTSARTRVDLTPHGFHAIIFSAAGTIYIDPLQRGDVDHYQSYFKRDNLPHPSDTRACTIVDEDGMGEEIARLVQNIQGRSGTQLRTYRAAVAATGEYTTFHGGTVPLGLAAVVTSMNRVTGVYEKEVAVRMVLVANNDDIIYTNGGTDPYTNNNGGTMLGQNQANLDAVIGNANYDIGHVFSTGGGGIAGLGVVCRTSQKARGVTGSPVPRGDNFDIDYVAHEIGHQYGSNHSFNGNVGSCSGGNRNASTAYEPGSGSTIMAYAGICGGQNLQQHSDDYFLWKSIDEIVAYTTVGSGNNCPTTVNTGVVEPTVNPGGGGFTIPLNTPFALTGSATTTGTATYCWEESDLGPAGHPNSPSGNAPIFRSFDPVAGPTRTFPKLTNLLNNTQTIGEILPSYARNLTFRLVVRDTQAGGVGVRHEGIAFSVASTGPFLVTSPNTDIIWQEGNQETVTWDVGGSNNAPVNCANVRILLSTDGGNTWPTVLLASTPNDGSQAVTVPGPNTTQARVKVEAIGNVFFDISNVNFRIEGTSGIADRGVSSGQQIALHAGRPNPFSASTAIGFDLASRGTVSVRIHDPAGRLVKTLLKAEMNAGSHQVLWDGTDESGRPVGTGVYLYQLDSAGAQASGRLTLVR